jgi:hypothetical protein
LRFETSCSTDTRLGDSRNGSILISVNLALGLSYL